MLSRLVSLAFSPTSFVLFIYYFNVLAMAEMEKNMATVPVKVGVVLDMDKSVAKMGLRAINMALSDLYASHPDFKTRLTLDVRDSKGDVVCAAEAAVDLIKNIQVKAIIGPVTSAEAQFMVNLGQKSQLPIVSYSATSPFLRSSSHLIGTCQNDAIQARAIGSVIKYFGWKEAMPIYVDDEFGQGIIPSLVDALQDTRIPYRSVISPSATDDEISQELYKLRTTMSTACVLIVHLPPSLGSRLFIKAKEAGMMSEDYAWIMTSGMTAELGSLDEDTVESMQGVLGVRTYVPNTKEYQEFVRQWKRWFPGEELNVYGLWAYDTTTALATAIERVGIEEIIIDDLANRGSSATGNSLLKSILDTNFTGLSGDFDLSQGQLHTSVFEILNVFGVGWKSIGFWTPENGLVDKLISSPTTSSSVRRRKLGSIIWPGDSTSIPNGLVSLASNEKPITMRVLVPKLPRFEQFLNVDKINHQTNKCEATGFSIMVFEEVVKTAFHPSQVDIQYFAYLGSFDDMIRHMHDQKYNACSGDISIRAHRFKYAGFTQPYTESSVKMVAPAYKMKKSYFFAKVVTWQLAAATLGLFLLNAVVIWIFEHKHNKHFKRKVNAANGAQRPLSLFIVDQVVESLYFSFSTMFFVQRQSITSNWTRLVMVIWFFVFLILAQSYTASMASYLSSQQLVPKFHDLELIRKAGLKVGYQDGSYVKDLLLNKIGLNVSQLVAYGSIDRMYELLDKGTKNQSDGVAAIVDDLPFLQLFIAKYCKDFTLVESVSFKSAGFGFPFQINSPYLHNVSEAIVQKVENKEMSRLFSRWIDNSTCNYKGAQYNFYQLNLEAFQLLFLISVCASTAGIIWYLVAGFPGERNTWCPNYRRTANRISLEGGIRPNGNAKGIQLIGRQSEPPPESGVSGQILHRLRIDDEPGENVQETYGRSSSPLTRTLTFPSFSRDKYFPLEGGLRNQEHPQRRDGSFAPL